uniref:Uncharacterized protein n=1 Tax=Anguilla anguilla TaxID=7936 RepID=A0A0E9W7Z5_ANGAN
MKLLPLASNHKAFSDCISHSITMCPTQGSFSLPPSL